MKGVIKKNQVTNIECIDCTDFQKSPKEVISDAHLKVIDFTDKSIIGAMIGAMISATIGRGVIINTSFQNSEIILMKKKVILKNQLPLHQNILIQFYLQITPLIYQKRYCLGGNFVIPYRFCKF